MSYTAASHLTNKPLELQHLLDFYFQEIQFLEKLLTEVVNKNTSHEALSEAEHFQNQFLIQRKNIDELKNRILQNHHLTTEEAKIHAGRVDVRLVAENENIGEEVHQLERIIADLRAAYKKYLLNWM
jgi:aspartyl-tRNA synthetase